MNHFLSLPYLSSMVQDRAAINLIKAYGILDRKVKEDASDVSMTPGLLLLSVTASTSSYSDVVTDDDGCVTSYRNNDNVYTVEFDKDSYITKRANDLHGFTRVRVNISKSGLITGIDFYEMLFLFEHNEESQIVKVREVMNSRTLSTTSITYDDKGRIATEVTDAPDRRETTVTHRIYERDDGLDITLTQTVEGGDEDNHFHLGKYELHWKSKVETLTS